ncbi:MULTISPECIES: hypothetical protein [Legionella]|uniref:hypothetical protein n=1 Tax=Legionella TaxID=445 RepID=UPI0010413BCF|nr:MULTISPECIES: hypothetical protein [Legionella]
MERKPLYKDCFFCESECQFGPGIYTGKRVPTYDFIVCGTCYQESKEGWSPRDEIQIIKHLEKKGLPIPKRNANGLLPRD